MKKFRLEGDPHEAEMVECEFGEFVKLSDAEKEIERLKNIIEYLKEASEKEKKLNKPFRLPSGSKKKFGVYVKNPKTGNTIMVKFDSSHK